MNTETVERRFGEFGLDPRLVDAVTAMGFEHATPIQREAIPPMLAGRDIIGGARTGSGKTAAFGLPALHAIDANAPGVQVLVLAPTRELVLQVERALRDYAKGMPIRTVAIYGGASYGPQLAALSRGVHVVVGTPGRVIDHLDRGTLNIGSLRTLVLDEADEMLRMGFIDDVERVLQSTPDGRQIVLFSATMPKAIRDVARRYLSDPQAVQVERESITVNHIEQRWMLVPTPHKKDALLRVLNAEPRGATLVFSATRAGCADAAEVLGKAGIHADALHGDMTQSAREQIIGRFRANRLDVLVATDVAARGLDIEHVTHVINMDLPFDTEAYVHRIGRTGRAGRDGVAITFVTPAERRALRAMERKLRVELTHVSVPSDWRIAMAQRKRLKDGLNASLDAAGAAHAEEWVIELLENGEFSPEQLAVAAVAMLAKSQRTNLRATVEKQPPLWSVERQDERRPRFSDKRRPESNGRFERPAADFSAVNEVEIHLEVGRKDRIRPADVVGALANELGISGKSVGRVTILGSRTVVGVPKAIAQLALDRHAKLLIRGKRIRMSLAQQRASTPKKGKPRPRSAARG